jgi:ClpP class serine protease
MSVNRGKHILSDFLDTVWFIHPENFRFLLDLATRNINFDEKLAIEKRTEIHQVQDSRMKLVGDTGIAYIPVRGTIHPRASLYTEVCGGTSISSLTSEFISARDNPDIKAILFDHDSPGGIATSINAFSNLVFESRGIKPIYSYVDGTCASADYWIASASDKLIVDETARLGSVGTVVAVPKKGADDMYVEITNSLSPFKRPDLENKEHYASIIRYLDEMTDVFHDSLARNMGVSKAHVIESFGKGGLKVGENAVVAKMATRTGSFDSCVEELLKQVDSGKTFQVMDNLSEANSQKNGGIMDIKELKANHPELVQAIENETLQTVESETSSLKEKIKTVEEENSSLKKSLVVKEKELSEKKASELFSASFDSSKIPAKFESKVFKDTELASFIDENGKLNEEGYKESVAKAVASWEEDFKDILVDKPEKEDKEENTDSFEDKEDKKILGTGTAEEEQSGADDDLIERMVKFATK